MNMTAPIVVAVDGSAASESAVRWAAQEAALCMAPLRIVFVVDRSEYFIPGFGNLSSDAMYVDPSRQVLESAARTAAQVTAKICDTEIHTALLKGPLVPTLLTESRTARTLVVGNRGLGAFSSKVLGSASSALARHAHCPVAVVHAMRSIADRGPVVVGVDGTANSEPAIGTAFEEASRRKACLYAVHAWSDASESLVRGLDWAAVSTAQAVALAESLAGWQEKFPDVDVQRVVVRTGPARELQVLSRDAQLVVVGSHGRGGFAGMLLGSTSEALLHSVECPILIVRGSRD
ncbi:universal stress protein [Smaragdicoccus niigatensis]|uniref:universal stress protein n=1 Tax=Smaragdicoccus niigatensis TaxID=359359 RepID=UPI0003A874DB|nr:universal stress protein [Smaragdicoccus niigatensis]